MYYELLNKFSNKENGVRLPSGKARVECRVIVAVSSTESLCFPVARFCTFVQFVEVGSK